MGLGGVERGGDDRLAVIIVSCVPHGLDVYPIGLDVHQFDFALGHHECRGVEGDDLQMK